jgi:hypothetical protein
MKKVIRLTESDLVKLVKKVIKEQYSEDDFEFNTINRDEQNRITHQHSDKFVALSGYSSKQIQRALSNLSENVGYIAFLDCEYADFSNINLCEFPELKFVNLTGTPNNLEETQGECYNILNNEMYDFDEFTSRN